MTTDEIREVLEETWDNIHPMTKEKFSSFRMKILDLLAKIDNNVGESSTANERRKNEAMLWIERLLFADNKCRELYDFLNKK